VFLVTRIGWGEVTNDDEYARGYLRFLPGAKPGKNLPGKESPEVLYCPKCYLEKI